MMDKIFTKIDSILEEYLSDNNIQNLVLKFMSMAKYDIKEKEQEIVSNYIKAKLAR